MDTLDFNYADPDDDNDQETQDFAGIVPDAVNLGIIDVADLGQNSLTLHPNDVLDMSDLIVGDVETLDGVLNAALSATGVDTSSKLAFVHGDEESRVNLANDDSHHWSTQPVAEVTTSSGNAYNVYVSEGAVALVDVNLNVVHS
jgi:hypothetical protein